MQTIRSYDYVNHPFEVVRDELIKDPVKIFSKATKQANTRAKDVVAELRVNIGGIEIGTDISIEVTVVEDRAKQEAVSPILVLEVAWKSTHLSGFFPIMHATLSVYPLTSTETQLDFSGTYDKPLGVLGNAIDAVVGRRIAEASIERFVKNVALYLRQKLTETNSSG